MLAAGVIGAALTLFTVHLSMLNPGQTLTQFSRALLGKWFGRIVVLPYLAAWYSFCTVILRDFTGFLQPILIDRTPLWIMMLIIMGLMIYLTSTAGITGIGRLCQIVGPVIIITLVISFVLNAGHAKGHYLLPVFSDTGWISIVKGSLGPAIWLPGPYTLLVVVAFMRNPRKALSSSLIGVGITIVLALAATLMVLMVFGPNLAAKIRYPYFLYVRTVDILDFIQNMDIFFMFIWIFGVSAQLSLLLFVASHESAQWFKAKSWRKFMWFSAPAIYAMALLIPDETGFEAYYNFGLYVVFPICGIAIPLLLWIVTLFRRKSVAT